MDIRGYIQESAVSLYVGPTDQIQVFRLGGEHFTKGVILPGSPPFLCFAFSLLVSCVCASKHTYVEARGIQSRQDGVTGDYEQPGVDAENWGSLQ